MESESKTRFPSKGTPPGRKGCEPVANKTRSALTIELDPSFWETTRLSVPPESANAANPCKKVTPAISSCRSISSELLAAKSTHELIISFQTESSRKPIPRKVDTLIRLDVSRRALLKRPVGPPRLRSCPLGDWSVPDAVGASMRMTRLWKGA